MIFSKSEYMLKYQKAKVKLLEYNVPKEDYPKFKLNYRDLAFPTIYTLSEYAEAIITDNQTLIDAKKKELFFCSQFYDAAMKSREQINHDLDFILTGAVAYFFEDNFGSAMVLLSETKNMDIPNDMRGLVVDIFSLIFTGKRRTKTDNAISSAFEKYLKDGITNNLLLLAKENVINAYRSNDESEAFFADALYAVIKIAIQNSARELLPIYSGLSIEKWEAYFEDKNAIRMIWPSQKLIGEKGILQGKNSIVQLPTGVGKTKSIELIVRAMFLSERGNTALIVAPLRALCNEIIEDMSRAFEQGVSINQFSDLLEIDFWDIFSDTNEKKILICTPEKLQFILHHEFEIMYDIDLFVFDEGHMFDDMSRGALYELLLADIKGHLKQEQQLVILSAVLSNAEQIMKWIMGENGVLAFNESIKSTPKVVGFASSTDEIHYYSDSFDEEDFYIPRAIKKTLLKSKRANAKPKYFPENTANDIALYYANVLCENGGVAIYMSQRRYIPTILNRLIEVSSRGYDFANLLEVSNLEEIEKLKKLIFEHYGEESTYYKAANLGILPHYSSLPNGVRISVEYAYRKNKIKAVACTSTLAQGVNIPIKYLIMTSLKSAQKMISTRNFQNLIGRTARSGVYTEGSILITDIMLFDNKGNGAGYYRWKDAIGLFEPKNSEACSSAILSVVKDFQIDYELVVVGKFICKFISEHIHEDWTKLLKEVLIQFLIKNNKDNVLLRQIVNNRVDEYSKIIGTIENEICYVVTRCLSNEELSETLIREETTKKMEELLALYLADDDEKKLLTHLFDAIAGKIVNNIDVVSRVSKTMVSMEVAEEILKWIITYDLNVVLYNRTELLRCIVELYNTLFQDDAIKIELCSRWIVGESYKNMTKEFNLSLFDIEKKCGQSISYQLSFLIGNIIDYLDAESVNLESFRLIQKEVKYGVNTHTAIAVCEKVFNDRILAGLITDELGNQNIGEDEILSAVKGKRNEIEDVLSEYPSYFADRIKFLCR